MKRLLQICTMMALVTALSAPAALAGGLSGVWTLDISQYKDSCGGKPTAAKELTLTQKGRALTAAIGIMGEGGKVHTALFKGTMDQDQPPAKASLHGKFDVGGFITEETIHIQFPDSRNYTGACKWKIQSADKKTSCVGSQKIAGRIK